MTLVCVGLCAGNLETWEFNMFILVDCLLCLFSFFRWFGLVWFWWFNNEIGSYGTRARSDIQGSVVNRECYTVVEDVGHRNK